MSRSPCSTHCWSLCTVVFATLLLIAAALAPWYYIYATYNGDVEELKGTALYVNVWYKGFESYAKTNGDSQHKTLSWDDAHADDAHSIYNAAVSMAFLGFFAGCFTIVVFLFTCIKNHHYGSACNHKAKFIHMALILVIMFFCFLSWLVFVSGWTSAIKKSDFCTTSEGGFSISGTLFCDKFIGAEKYEFDVLATNSEFDVLWGASASWYLALIANVFLIIGFILAICIKRHPHTREYHSINPSAPVTYNAATGAYGT